MKKSRSSFGVLARMLFCLGVERAAVLVVFFSQVRAQWVVGFRLSDQRFQRLDYCNNIHNYTSHLDSWLGGVVEPPADFLKNSDGLHKISADIRISRIYAERQEFG